MIPEYISPPIDRVIQIAFLALGVSFLIAKLGRVSLSPLSLLVLLAAAVTATGVSLFYSYQFRGGDYFWLRRGYPHYFWGAGDISGFPDMTVSNALQGLDWGPAGIYLLGNLFFYASLFLCAYVILSAMRNRIRAVQ